MITRGRHYFKSFREIPQNFFLLRRITASRLSPKAEDFGRDEPAALELGTRFFLSSLRPAPPCSVSGASQPPQRRGGLFFQQ
jgi:hypothetical protein